MEDLALYVMTACRQTSRHAGSENTFAGILVGQELNNTACPIALPTCIVGPTS